MATDGGWGRVVVQAWGMSLVLAVVTFGVYWPVVGCEFTDFDDPDYFTSNPHVLGGLTWDNITWAFRMGGFRFWHPLTWLSLMADVELFGRGSAGPHFMNLVLHVVNTVLVFHLFRRLTGALWRSAMVAGLFALHPLRVESVAWVCERKDVLSVLFGLLALIFYGCYAQRQKVRRKEQRGSFVLIGSPYLLSLFFFVLGLMSKPMVVTLPFVMLLLDYWPLQRMSNVKCQVSGSEAGNPQSLSLGAQSLPFWRLVWEKMPFFVLGVISSAATFLLHRKDQTMAAFTELTMTARIENAFISYARYLGKTFWPVDLAFFYPHPVQWAWAQVALAMVLVVGLCLAAVWLGGRRRYVFVGWYWFWGTLIPVIGLVQVGSQAMADRFTYVPLIGMFVILPWFGEEVVERWQRLRVVMRVIAVLVLCACAVRTRDQLRYWQNGGVLSRHALAVTRDNYIAYENLGAYLSEKGQTNEAIDNYRQALRINPTVPDGYNNLGLLLAAKGKSDEAIIHFRAALKYKPNYSDAHVNLAVALADQGKFDEAISHHTEALSLDPNSAFAHKSLANTLAKLGYMEEAMAHYTEAVRLSPDYAEAHNNLGNILAARGKLDEAVVHFHAALQYKTNYASAHNNWGVILAAQGKYEEAIEQYGEALRLDPGSPVVESNMGYALAQLGRLEEAVAHYREALRLRPDNAQAHFYLGKALEGLGRRQEAVAQMNEVLRLDPNNTEAKEQLRALGVPTTE